MSDAILVQNSFRISTDVDTTTILAAVAVQNSFRISTDVDRLPARQRRTGPKLISNFYWCRFTESPNTSIVQNSFRISTDVDAAVPAVV